MLVLIQRAEMLLKLWSRVSSTQATAYRVIVCGQPDYSDLAAREAPGIQLPQGQAVDDRGDHHEPGTGGLEVRPKRCQVSALELVIEPTTRKVGFRGRSELGKHVCVNDGSDLARRSENTPNSVCHRRFPHPGDPGEKQSSIHRYS
jgi:hypothetical protein